MIDVVPSLRFLRFVLALLALCGHQTVVAAQESASSSGLAADATVASVALIPWATVIIDEKRNKTVEEVIKAEPSVKNIGREVFSPGYSTAAYWFVIPLENNQAFPLERWLVINPSWLDDVRVTLIDSQGGLQSFEGGDTLPFAQRAEAYRRTNFVLTVQPGKSLLVVRTATRDPYFVGLDLMERKAFDRNAANEALYFGLLYGGLVSLLLFNFVLFLSSREKDYFVYCVWLTAFLAMHATYNGHVFRWLLPESPNAHNWASSVFIYVYCFCGLVFAMVFLDLKAKQPIAYTWTRRLLYFLGLTFVVSAMVGGYRANIIISIAWVVVFAATAFALGLLSLQRHNAAAVYYLSASTAGLVGSTCTALTAMSIVPYTFMTFRAVDIGILIDAIMVSLALAAQVTQGRRLERLRRFFSPAVADQLLSAPIKELYRPHQREIVVLFLDLRGYTAFTQAHGANEVMRILGEFHTAMGELIASYEATLERFAGDGMMIFLNDPIEIPNPAVKAGEMALEMQARFKDLNKMWQQRDYSLSMGIGIAQGMATIGAIGFEGRRDYAAIGNVTNLAARLCAEAGAGQILVSSVVAGNLDKSVQLQSMGAMVLKGFSEPVQCYEIATLPRQKPVKPIGLGAPDVV